jgi:geranylgeranyl diphosphate synthase, type I
MIGSMRAFLDSARGLIAAALTDYLAGWRKESAAVTGLGADLCDRLLDFSLQGKMIRGCLVPVGSSLCGGRGEAECRDDPLVTAGAAMELFQSGLLIHDDIMDRDPTRRGRPSMFRQYAEAASRRGSPDPLHLGEAQGICAGDAAYFLAFELLGRMRAEPAAVGSALRLCARELTRVGMAQMQDVAWGASPADVAEEEILRMYTFKTARYSFSLPLSLGAVIAGAADERLAELGKLGECLGILFQIRDDELGLFGSAEELGKPVGSDVREGKKTLYYAGLMARAGPEERERLRGVFGNPESSERDLAYVRGCAESLGVRDQVEARARGMEEKARGMIEAIGAAGGKDRRMLVELLDFISTRRR